MTRKNINILTVVLTLIIILSSYPAFANAKPTTLQANPLYRIKAAGLNPNAIGADNPYYTPTDIKNAYHLPSSGGSGIIAIVDAYNDPSIAANLASFSSQWGLPSPNLVIHKMSTFVQSNSGWGMEESLDVEWAHAIAPNAEILLVEATSASTGDLLSAVSYAAGQSGVVAISMSWGASEFSGERSYDSYFTSTSGAAFFASSGDTGGVVTWPSSSANVVSVGGTTLTQTATGYTEKAWSGGGGGVSAYEPAAVSQASLGYSNRATPDVSYNADPNTGFLVLDTYGYSGWYAVGGTSAGAPQWAAIQSLGLSVTSQNLYKDSAQPSTYAADFTDIISGSNTVYSATTGYDLATGLGSPLTTGFTPATTPDFSLSASPSTVQAGGSAGTSTITASSLNGYGGTINLNVQTAPAGWTASLSTSQFLGGSGVSQLSITVPSSTTAGTYSISIQGADASGTPTHTTTVTVTVTTPDFSLTSSPSTMTIQAGGSAGTSTITATSLNSYGGTLNLGLSGNAASWASITTPISVTSTTPGTSTLTVSAPQGTTSGTYTVTVTATDAINPLLSHTTTITVIVANPDFSISAAPSSMNIRSGSQGTSKITISALNQFKGTVALAATTSGGGLTATLSPPSITGSGSSTLTIKVPSTTRSGTFTVKVTATSGSTSHSATITVTVSRF